MAPTSGEAQDVTPDVPAMKEVDILGLSCRFPESAHASEFWDNLTQGRDMVTSNDKRWPVGLHGTPPRSGKVPDFEKFDASFFSVHGKQAQKMDPQMRKLLEVSWEAWMDSGIDVNQLRGSSRVGVYIGCCGSEVHAAWLADIPNITGYEQTGCTQSMFANRLSWTFDFRGPSKAVDTACSSSALALHDAIADLSAGRCDYAMVGGASSILRPATSVAFNKLHMLSPDGSCKSFSAAANGYTRADGIAMLVLRRSNVITSPRWAARDPYARVVNIGTNNDGHTKEGITFPSSDAQGQLARQVCRTAGVAPSEVGYVEAHGTGTVVGDGQELGAIDGWYGKAAGRGAHSPLLLGSVKSNMGHCEGASGLAGVIKLCLSYEHGTLPGNLHFNEPNPNCPSLHDGTLQVVDSTRPWDGGYAALSSFGFGGSNVHLLMRGYPSPRAGVPPLISLTAEDASLAANGAATPAPPVGFALTDALPLAARTAEGMEKLVAAIKEMPDKQALIQPLRRLANTVAQEAKKFPCRGVLLGSELRSAVAPTSPPQVFFVFTGNGSQWSQMGLSLLRDHPTFRTSIFASAVVAKDLGVDLLAEFEDEAGFKDPARSALGLCSLQIALVDILTGDYGITPHGMLGHSAGEIACGYASKCLTRKQTLEVAFHRGRLPITHGLKGGLMAATGLSAADALTKTEGTPVVLACDNSPTSTTLSGPAEEVRKIAEALKADGVFVREVETLGLAFHSPALEPLLPELRQELIKSIPEPKERPSNWISTSFEADSADPTAKLCSADYQVHSYRNRVLFTAAAQAIPKDALLLEVGPHALLRSPLRQSRPDLPYVSLMRKGECGLDTLAAAVGDLWRKGAAVQWPANPTPDGVKGAELPRVIRQALTSWDHSTDYPMPQMTAASGQGFTKTYELGGEHAFLGDHQIDSRILMPATSYLVTAWDALATQMGKPMSEVAVTWSDVSIYQAVQADSDSKITLSVLLDRSNRFQVLNGTDLIAEGRIKANAPKTDKEAAEKPAEAEQAPEWPFNAANTVDAAAFYRDVARTGINYGPHFRMVQRASVDGTIAFMRWDSCFIRFLDGMLQSSALGSTDYQLRIPVKLRHVAITDACPNIPNEASVRVDVDYHCGAARTAFCEVAGVELSTAPKRPPGSKTVITRMTWVPYGLRTAEDPARAKYAVRMGALLKTLVLPQLRAMETLPAHLAEVASSLEEMPGSPVTKIEQQELAEGAGNELAKVILAASSQEGDFLQNLTSALGSCEGMAASFQADPLLSGFGLPQAKVMMDIALENMKPEGFTACELGVGSGGLTKQVLAELNGSSGTDMVGYTATDATADAAGALAAALPTPKLKFQTWDINGPAPAALSTPPDFVLASHAFPYLEDIAATLGHIRSALAPGGFLYFQELTGPLGTCLWGLSNRPHRGSLGWTVEQWQQQLASAGFAEVSTLRCASGASASFLFRKTADTLAPAVKMVAASLPASNEDIDTFLADYQSATEVAASMDADNEDSAEGIAKAPTKGRVWLHGNKRTSPGLLGFALSARKEPRGDLLRFVFSTGADAPPSASLIESARPLDLLHNMFLDGRNGSYRALLVEDDNIAADTGLDSGCHLEFSNYGDLSSIVWAENEQVPPSLASSVISCDVAYGALNFRDVMLAYGKLSRDLMAHGKGGDYIGLEFSGKVSGEDRRVMGVAQNAIATQVSTPAYLLWDVPATWSLAEAATVPVAYATAYYALLIRGRLRPDFSVLIHSGSGAVGLAAIQICLSRGCEVFTTCGSETKKRFLLDTFPGLKECNISDSRSCAFEQVVLAATQGKGVHLVLNSLADDKLQASVRCLASRGRLLEIGKYDILRGTPLSMKPLLRNIAFDGIDLDRVFNDAEDTTEVEALHNLLQEGVTSGEVQPLPLTVFTHAQCEDAFRYMAKGVHIGKCMIEMRQEEGENLSNNSLGPKKSVAVPADPTPTASTPALPLAQRSATAPTFTCREDRSYLITGGLGGFGLALAHWLVQKGARFLVLTSKRGLRTGAQAKAIQQLRNQGVQVEVSTLDVADEGETHQMMQLASDMAPVAGVFHLAMQLTDKWIANQTGEGWNAGVIPKALGGRHLDAASRQLPHLEHFVMFSSIVASAGNEGQSNYGWSNSALDMMCEDRAAAGLPALSIQWGVIGHVGFVEEAMNGKMIGRLAEISLAQPVDDCLKLLGRFLCGGKGQTPVVGSYWQPANMLGGAAAGSDKDLMTAILDIMGLKASDVSDSDTLASMGIDSMQLVEVRANIQRALGRPIPLEEIGTMTIGGLKALAEAAGATAHAAVPSSAASPPAEEVRESTPEAAVKSAGSKVGKEEKPSEPTTPDTPEKAEARRSIGAAPQTSVPSASTKQPSAAFNISASCHVTPVIEDVAPAQDSAVLQLRRQRMAWSVMSGAGILTMGVLIFSAALPFFQHAAALATSQTLPHLLLALPLLWLCLGACMCLGTVLLKRLLMPVLAVDRPIQLWSLDFARWWMVQRAIDTTNRLFGGRLRGTPFLVLYMRGLGATIGSGAFIDSLDFMDLDMVEIGDDAVVGEGATLVAHTFDNGQLTFKKVVIGSGAKVQPFSIVTPSLVLAPGDTLAAASCSLLAPPRRAQVKSAELCRGLSNLVDSQELGVVSCAALQIAALYLVNLLVTMAACIGLAVAALALNPVGMPATLMLQPTAVAAAAMVAMSSHFLLAFLPLLMPVAGLAMSIPQAAACISAVPLGLAITALTLTLLAAAVKYLAVGRIAPGLHRRNSAWGVRFWLSQRLVECAYSHLGSLLVGTWAMSTFYRLFGARVGKWTTFRFGNAILCPDQLQIGDWVHVGDTANVVTSMAMDSRHILSAPAVIHDQALLGLQSVVLPGTVVGAGASLGALSSPAMGSALKPGIVHVGTPAIPLMRAAPSPGPGETPCGPTLRALVATFPAIQLFAALASTTAALLPAAVAAHALSGPATAGLIAAAVVTLIATTGLCLVGAASKALLVGTLKPAEGIKKYSLQNLGRMLAWVLEMRADAIYGHAAKGSSWWNRVLRSRGLTVGEDVYVDTLWAGDYELVSLGEGAVVDRGATVFAHLGMYKGGVLSMMQAPVEVKGTVGARAAVLPGFSLVKGNVLAPGGMGMKMSI